MVIFQELGMGNLLPEEAAEKIAETPCLDVVIKDDIPWPASYPEIAETLTDKYLLKLGGVTESRFGSSI